MADSNLYKVLSGLNTTDSLLKTKLVQLSGQVSPAFEANKITIGTANGIISSTYEIGGLTSGAFGAENKLATEVGAKQYTDGQIDILKGNINEIGDAILSSTATGGALTTTYANHGVNYTLATDEKTIGQTDGSLKSLITLTKLGTPSAGFASTYELRDASGAKIGDEINIPKDQFLKNAEFVAAATAADVTAAGNNPGFSEGEPVIKLTFELTGTSDDTDSTIYIPVNGLVDVYTAGNGIDITNNVVTAVAKSGDKYIEVLSSGIASKGIDDAIDAASKALWDSTNTSGAVYDALETAKGRITNIENSLTSGAIDGRLDALEAKTSGAITEGNVVIGGASGQYVNGGKTLGAESYTGQNSDTFGGSNKLATEAAVAQAIDAVQTGANSAYIAKIGDGGNDEHVVIFNGNGNAIKDASRTVGSDSTLAANFGGTDNVLATEKAVVTYVNENLATLVQSIETLQGQIRQL